MLWSPRGHHITYLGVNMAASSQAVKRFLRPFSQSIFSIDYLAMPLARPTLDSVRYPTDGYTNTNAINPVTPWLLRKPSSLWGRLSATCHPERSEGSRSSDTQILRSAQNDTPLNAFVLDDLGLSGDVVGARREHMMCSERTLIGVRGPTSAPIPVPTVPQAHGAHV